MVRNVFILLGAALLTAWSFEIAAGTGGKKAIGNFYLADLHVQSSQIADVSPKLSQALIATKDAGGVLYGSDAKGRPLIAVPEGMEKNLIASKVVKNAKPMSVVPEDVRPVERLMLIYNRNTGGPKEADLKELGLKLIEDYNKGSYMIVEPINHKIDATLAKKLEGNVNVKYATPSFQIQVVPPMKKNKEPVQPAKMPPVLLNAVPPTNDPKWGSLWGMRSLRADKAWAKVKASPAIVAVIDTGVDYTHEDLVDNMWKNTDNTHGFNYIDNNTDPMDKNGHGTHCSGTVGVRGNNNIGVVGVNWEIKIMALRWLDAAGSGDVANAIKCIDWAIEHDAKVLSNSWYWYEDNPALEMAISRANDRGVLFVAAASNFAGNNDDPATVGRYPSSYNLKNIIAVAAINEQEKLADFSSFGKKTVHIGAPGVSIMSTVPQNNYDGTYSGTSMATPHVAGAAALVYGLNGNQNLEYQKVRDSLILNARKIPDLMGRCVSEGTLDLSFLGK